MSGASATLRDLAVKERSDCEFDVVSLGEVMLRLDPGERRIRAARRFDVWEGGGEYNVARALSRCFGLRSAVVTALADNEVGHLVEELILAGGVNTELIRWFETGHDGAPVRNGLNFTERGFGVRGAVGVSDRRTRRSPNYAPRTSIGPTSSSVGECDGCTRAESSRRCHRRPPRWQWRRSRRQRQRDRRVVRPQLSAELVGRGAIAATGNESRSRRPGGCHAWATRRTSSPCLDYSVPGVDAGLEQLPTAGFRTMIEQVGEDFSNVHVVATTLRTVRSASRNDWGAIVWVGARDSTRRPSDPTSRSSIASGVETRSPRASSSL